MNIQLVKLLKLHRRSENMSKIDQCLFILGHEVLRIPPCLCNLNPIKLPWVEFKRFVRQHKLDINNLFEITERGINAVIKEVWQSFCAHVAMVENEY